MVGNNCTGIRFITAQDHVAAGLATELKAGALKRGSDFTTSKDRWGALPRRSSFCLRRVNFNKFFAALDGYRITGLAAILHVKFHGFADIAQCLGAVVALTDTAG